MHGKDYGSRTKARQRVQGPRTKTRQGVHGSKNKARQVRHTQRPRQGQGVLAKCVIKGWTVCLYWYSGYRYFTNQLNLIGDLPTKCPHSLHPHTLCPILCVRYFAPPYVGHQYCAPGPILCALIICIPIFCASIFCAPTPCAPIICVSYFAPLTSSSTIFHLIFCASIGLFCAPILSAPHTAPHTMRPILAPYTLRLHSRQP